MQKETDDLLKRFEEEYETYVSATDKLTYWIIYARIPKTGEKGTHHLHNGKKYVTGPNEEGNVLILPDPDNSELYEVESWGNMPTIDDFVKKALPRILFEKQESESGNKESCGASCS